MPDLINLFYPKSIAIIGVSNNPIKGASAFLYALRSVNFPNPVYSVNKTRDKVIFDENAYPTILDIPENIDYAIIGVPAKEVPQVVNECGQKGVKFITIFSSGFSELGTKEGRALEEKFLQNTNSARIVGPNCLGVYCQESRVTITEILNVPEREGEVSYISQSGGHTGSFYLFGTDRGFGFNKVVSIGNQCDLTIQDFIEYYAQDEKTKVISCYLESIKDSPNFFKILQNTTPKKPVIFWKGGQTQEGSLAASSHTGAISSSYTLFKAAIHQSGGIIANSLEELADLTLGSLFLSDKQLGNQIGILVPGGGSCVEMTDEAIRNGLKVPEFSEETKEKIQAQIQEVNTSTRNPADLGVFGWLPIVYSRVLLHVAEDPNIDTVIFYFMTERLPSMIDRMNQRSLGKQFLKNIKKTQRKSDKPFICLLPNIMVADQEITRLRTEFINGLIDLKIPHFPSMERAANVISKLIKYKNFKIKHEKNG